MVAGLRILSKTSPSGECLDAQALKMGSAFRQEVEQHGICVLYSGCLSIAIYSVVDYRPESEWYRCFGIQQSTKP